MYKTIAFLKRRPGMSREEFIEYYEGNHVPLVLSLGRTPPVYKRNYLVPDVNSEAAGFDFDVITEIAFASEAEFVAWAEELNADGQVAADELRLFDPASCRPIRSLVLDPHATSDEPLD